MREREEDRSLNQRRSFDEDASQAELEPESLTIQSLASLQEGYSWIRDLEGRHPGWHPHPVEGFAFTLPQKPLSDSRVCLVSLAGVYRNGQKPFNIAPGPVPPEYRSMRFRSEGDWTAREIPARTKPKDLSIAHAWYDHSEAAEDINCVFPLARLLELEVEEYIGECAEIHYSLMGHVPESERIVQTAIEEIIPGLRSQEADVVLVSGGCELSHHSAALVEREIEAAGIPTVGITVCPDITYHMQVPRAAALRFPLGNPFGAALDEAMQTRILKHALSLVETLQQPGEVVSLPYDWMKL